MSRKTLRTIAASSVATVALLLAACGVDSSEGLKTASGNEQPADGGGGSVSDGTGGGGSSGGGGQTADPGDFQGTGGVVFLNRAAEATSEVKTQSMEIRTSMEVMGSPMEMVMTGQIDLENELLQMEIDLGMGDLFGDLEGDMGDLGDLGIDLGDMKITMIQAGDQMYMRSPLFSMFTGADTPWISMPVDEMDSLEETQQAQDPNDFLEFLKATDAEVEEHGREDVRGVSTQHLSTVLDLRSILDQAEGSEKEELEEALDGLGMGVEEMPMDVWIDDEGMIRRMTMSFDMSGMDDEIDMGSIEMTIELFDFNEPVDIRVPDASEVSEFDPSDLGGDFDF